ncbi:DUF4198 domain-containing protein [Desulfovibrio sp. JC010]|uniref:DUF4198 domain-containing protein n=1 Tax=Desulfovibrio sp. JC010 TaxID=2593641 RepID=UPI0013D77EE5|nr:DUF4198 domain-containing protein [Desulfovibrio sp. JC010]NDV28039.1 DUF4198 domain-containing protein [Desulfovibrio sp. JC010]
MKHVKLTTLVLSCLLAVLCCSTAFAHEFIIKPVQLTAEKGHVVPFSIVSAHVFMISEEMEPINEVSAKLVLGGKSTPVKLAENGMLMTLDGQVKPETEGTAIIAGHRNGMIWTQTTKGWKQQSKKGLKGVIKSGKYEKFCKALLTIGKPDGSYNKVLGQRLEIIPMSDPTQAKVGDEIEFQTLLDGKPVSVESMTATYDGFSMNPNTYAYFTEPYGNGLTKVKITAPGTWMVRVQHVNAKPTADYDSHVMRSVLVFEVK